MQSHTKNLSPRIDPELSMGPFARKCTPPPPRTLCPVSYDDGMLPSRARLDDFKLLHRLTLDPRGHLRLLLRPESELRRVAYAPGEDLSDGRDGKVVSSARSDRDDVRGCTLLRVGEGELGREGDVRVGKGDALCGGLGGFESGLLRVHRRPALVVDLCLELDLQLLPSDASQLLGDRLSLLRLDHRGVLSSESRLESIAASTCPDLAVAEEEQRVVDSSRHGDDACTAVLVGGERLDEGGCGDNVLPSSVVGRDSRLAERVETPGVDKALSVDGERVVGPRADEDDVAQGETSRSESVLLVSCN